MNNPSINIPANFSPYQCFANKPSSIYSGTHSTAVTCLQHQLLAAPIAGKDYRLEAFGRVIPFLICGEQSAIDVFGNAGNIDSTTAVSLLKREFAKIESEEAGHELLWQTLVHQLPQPADLRLLKRRAALFFARLGRADTVAEHFAQVSQLDSAVGAIMWSLEHSEIAKDERVKAVAKLIKHDEARHVSVSRRFALGLGVERDKYHELGSKIRHELLALLAPIADSIEDLGIDASAMFKRIAKS